MHTHATVQCCLYIPQRVLGTFFQAHGLGTTIVGTKILGIAYGALWIWIEPCVLF